MIIVIDALLILLSWCSLLIPFGLKPNLLFLSIILISFSFRVYLNNFKIKLNVFYLIFILYVITSFILLSIYWKNYGYILYPIYLISSLLLVLQYKKFDYLKIIKLLSIIIFSLEVASIISFIFYYFQILSSPSFCFSNNDFRENCIYFLSTSNSYFENNFFKPAAIYDENGTFAFVICSVILLRHLHKSDQGTTNMIVVAGLITFSLMYYIFAIIYILIISKNIKFMYYILFILIGAIFSEPIYDNIISRFFIKDDYFIGDNRSERIITALDYIMNFRGFFWGKGPECVITNVECNLEYTGVFGENPFTIHAGLGFFPSLIYYTLFLFVFKFFSSSLNILYLLFLLMIILKPNIFQPGYALLILMVLNSFFKYEN